MLRWTEMDFLIPGKESPHRCLGAWGQKFMTGKFAIEKHDRFTGVERTGS